MWGVLRTNAAPRTLIVRQFAEVSVGCACGSTACLMVTKSNSSETRCNTVVADADDVASLINLDLRRIRSAAAAAADGNSVAR
jgi:hypothetical protein